MKKNKYCFLMDRRLNVKCMVVNVTNIKRIGIIVIKLLCHKNIKNCCMTFWLLTVHEFLMVIIFDKWKLQHH